MVAFPLHSLNLLGSCKLSLILPFTGIGENKLPYIWKPKSDFWPQVIFFKILLRWCGWRDPPCTCKYTKYIDHPQDRKYFFYFLFFFMATNERYTRSPTPPMNRDWRIPVTFSEKKRICDFAKRYWEYVKLSCCIQLVQFYSSEVLGNIHCSSNQLWAHLII